MFFRILKKDLKRKKTMNMILFLFVVLATMFVSSGLNNVLTVASGTDYYLNKAGVGDYVAITIGDEGRGYLDKALADEETVMAYRIEPIIAGNQNNLTLENGEETITKNALIIQDMESSVITFFNSNNEPVTEVEKGHAYVSGAFLEKNELEAGDKIVLEHSGTRMEFILDGKVKDALLGSDFMGNTRIIINQEDMKKFSANEEIMKYYAGEICYIDTDDTDAVGRILTEIPDLNFSGIRSTLKLCYVMDMIVAFVVLILSVCLMIVSFVVLKFSITFTIAEEFREIGVMKAIGITNTKIRLLYIGKYFMISMAGALVGLLLSVPFGNLLIKTVSENMVLGNGMGIALNMIGAIVVVATILLFAYKCTGKVKKSSPVDAIRMGQTGERYRKKAIYRMGRSHTRPSLYMALNDVISSPKRYLTIMLSFFLCMLFVLVLVNTTETMKSDKLIYTFGTKADLYMTDIEMAMEDMKSDNRFSIEAELDKEAKKVSDMGMPCKISVENQYKYPVTLDGTRYLVTASQGFNISAVEY